MLKKKKKTLKEDYNILAYCNRLYVPGKPNRRVIYHYGFSKFKKEQCSFFLLRRQLNWGRQLSRQSLNVALDTSVITLLKECGHIPPLNVVWAKDLNASTTEQTTCDQITKDAC